MEGASVHETARLDKLEDSLRKTQDSMLLMSKDVHQMNSSVESIAHSIRALVKIQQDLKILEERNEQRHIQLKEADKAIHNRIDGLETIIDDGIKPKTLKGILSFSIVIILSFASFVTIFIFTNDKNISNNANQISYLKGRLK